MGALLHVVIIFVIAFYFLLATDSVTQSLSKYGKIFGKKSFVKGAGVILLLYGGLEMYLKVLNT